jgi:cysteine dioxygenase
MHAGQTGTNDAALARSAPFGRLVERLNQIDFPIAPADAVTALLHGVRIDDESLSGFTNFIPGRYSRNGVYRNPRFELIVMCWPANVFSAIHEHGGSRGFVLVQRGSLVAENYTLIESDRETGTAQLSLDGKRTLRTNDIELAVPGRDVHRVGAVGGNAISLHLYAKPLDKFLVFDQTEQTCRQVTSRYDMVPYTEIS